MEEKTGGRIPAGSVVSISIELLRKGGPAAVCELLCSLKKVHLIKLPWANFFMSLVFQDWSIPYATFFLFFIY